MADPEIRYPESLRPEMIAPCGMDCAVCSRAMRVKDRCSGCRSTDGVKPKYCQTCRIRNCDEIVVGGKTFCFECPSYPCPRLRRLDARYRTRYGMSMLDNLAGIQEAGLEAFVGSERRRWTCRGCGALICVHKQSCIRCGLAREDRTGPRRSTRNDRGDPHV